jgi:hypothetical protein
VPASLRPLTDEEISEFIERSSNTSKRGSDQENDQILLDGLPASNREHGFLREYQQTANSSSVSSMTRVRPWACYGSGPSDRVTNPELFGFST